MISDTLFLDLIPIQNHGKQRSDAEFMILSDKFRNEIFYLNTNTSDVYCAIDGRKSVREILRYLQTIFDVDYQILENDFVSFLRDLQWKRLIQLKEKKDETI